MTTETARSTGRDRDDRSIAEWFCLIVGATLIIAGLLGFLVEPKFDTSVGGDPGQIDGEKLILFEVNGWHNVVHILTGLFLLAFGLQRRPRPARTAALAFGIVYAVVTVIGLIDGEDLFGLVPVNPADNILHLVLSLTAIAAALMTRPDPERERRLGARGDDESSGRTGDTSRRVETSRSGAERQDRPAGGAHGGDDLGSGAVRPGEGLPPSDPGRGGR